MRRRLNFGGHAPPRGTFGKLWRRTPARLSDAEHDALFAEYVASGQAARDREYVTSGQAARDERAYRVKRERARLVPTPATSARATPRTRERRDTGARQTVATSDGSDSDPGEPALPAASSERTAP